MPAYETRKKERRLELQLVDHPSGLDPAEIAFCLEYALTGHIAQAAQLAAVNLVGMDEAQFRRLGLHILRKPAVKQYLRDLLKRVEECGVADLLEVQMFLSDALRTGAGDVDGSDPLCQRKTTVTTVSKDGETTERVTVETVNKMAAAKLLTEIKGWSAPIKVDVNHSGGVMLVPMVPGGVDDWSKLAADQQKELMEDAIDI